MISDRGIGHELRLDPRSLPRARASLESPAPRDGCNTAAALASRCDRDSPNTHTSATAPVGPAVSSVGRQPTLPARAGSRRRNPDTSHRRKVRRWRTRRRRSSPTRRRLSLRAARRSPPVEGWGPGRRHGQDRRCPRSLTMRPSTTVNAMIVVGFRVDGDDHARKPVDRRTARRLRSARWRGRLDDAVDTADRPPSGRFPPKSAAQQRRSPVGCAATRRSRRLRKAAAKNASTTARRRARPTVRRAASRRRPRAPRRGWQLAQRGGRCVPPRQPICLNGIENMSCMDERERRSAVALGCRVRTMSRGERPTESASIPPRARGRVPPR